MKLISGIVIFFVGYYFLFVSSGDINVVCLVSEGNFITGQEKCVGLLSIFSQGIQTVGFVILSVISIISAFKLE